MKKFGAMKPVIDSPRNFHLGAFRGGSSPEQLFQRLRVGIDGTPMLPVAYAANGNPGLSDDDIWCLVLYVQSLGPKSQTVQSSVAIEGAQP